MSLKLSIKTRNCIRSKVNKQVMQCGTILIKHLTLLKQSGHMRSLPAVVLRQRIQIS